MILDNVDHDLMYPIPYRIQCLISVVSINVSESLIVHNLQLETFSVLLKELKHAKSIVIIGVDDTDFVPFHVLQKHADSR